MLAKSHKNTYNILKIYTSTYLLYCCVHIPRQADFHCICYLLFYLFTFRIHFTTFIHSSYMTNNSTIVREIFTYLLIC